MGQVRTRSFDSFRQTITSPIIAIPSVLAGATAKSLPFEATSNPGNGTISLFFRSETPKPDLYLTTPWPPF